MDILKISIVVISSEPSEPSSLKNFNSNSDYVPLKTCRVAI